MNTFPPPTAPIPPRRRSRRRDWTIVGIVIGCLFVIGSIMQAVDKDDTAARAHVAAVDPGQASSTGDADIDVMAIDGAWAQNHDELCDAWADVKDLPNIENFTISKFEEGYGQKLTARGRAHFLALLHTC
jgi:hypothetical protein